MFEQHILSCRRRKNTENYFVGCIQKDLAVEERMTKKSRQTIYIDKLSFCGGGSLVPPAKGCKSVERKRKEKKRKRGEKKTENTALGKKKGKEREEK